jgi:hypothetical protein
MRSSLHRCLQRHGISRLPKVTGDKEPKKTFKTYPSATSTSTSPPCAPPRVRSTPYVFDQPIGGATIFQ